jgi:hypothetical protein
LPISDSLNGTTSVIELRSASTAKDELDDEEAEDEAAVLPPVRLAPAPAAAVLAAEELAVRVVPVADTFSPTCPDSDAIVPADGAYSRVASTACSSLWTVS